MLVNSNFSIVQVLHNLIIKPAGILM